MTKKQDYLYWSEWAAVKRTCETKNLPLPDRHELHKKALGEDKSHKHFTNPDFDKVLAEFRAISRPASLNSQVRQIQQPDTRVAWNIENIQIPSLAALIRLESLKTAATHPDNPTLEQARAEYLEFKAGRAPLRLEDYPPAEAYIAEIMQAKFRTTDITQISRVKQPRGRRGEWEKSDLELLRDTLDARINQLRKTAGITIHDLNQLAALKCHCKPCLKNRARASHESEAQDANLQPAQ